MIRKEEVDRLLFETAKLTDAEGDALLQALVQKKYQARLDERVDLSKRKTIGRPSRMQPEVIERLLIALRQGASIKMACSFAGISHDLFAIWSKKARTYQDTLKKVTEREIENEALGVSETKLTPYENEILNKASKETMDCVELFVLVDQAIAECGVRDLNAITKAANNGAWTAAAFRLSKRFPEEYGSEPQQTNVNVQVGFQYVEVNRINQEASEVATPKQIGDANDRAVRAAELGIIDVEANEPA